MSRSTLGLRLTTVAVVLAASTVQAQRPQPTPEFKEEILVTAETPRLPPLMKPRSSSEHMLTFSGPFGLPGKSLPAGTYLFKVQSSRTFQVLSADQSIAYAWLQAVPITRDRASDKYEAWFGEPSRDRAPRRLTAWFLPNETTGYEILYLDRHAENALPALSQAGN
jgi:hypothetical protein